MIYFPLSCGAYQWEPFTPDSINALTVCFDAGWPYVVGTTKGLLINDGPSYSWISYNYNLPVWDIIPDIDSSGVFFLVMGNGSYSDGIYKFYLSTHTYRVIEWVINPTFIKFNPLNHTYYVGTRFNGLKTSSDGYSWTDVGYFNGKAAAAMDIYNNHICVVQENNTFATFYSNDTGRTWQQSSSLNPFHDIAFNSEGKLYGIFTGLSNSSGLYSSNNYGETWNYEQLDLGMNTVGFDVIGNVFVGWHFPIGYTNGIGVYDITHHDFGYLNRTLPCMNINKFKINQIMASITMFACTDSGVYFCNNYISELEIKNITSSEKINAFPNPSNELINLSIPSDLGDNNEIIIYNSSGQIVKIIFKNKQNITIYKNDLGEGLYYYQFINNHNKVISGKFLFL